MTLSLPLVVDRASPVPLYHQLAEQFSAAIKDGTLVPGDPFENELALAGRLELSRPTVRRAIAELVHRGLLVRRRGIGTTVASAVVHRRDELTSLFDDLERNGRNPRTQVLEFDPGAHNDTAAAFFEVPAQTPLVSLRRLRSADAVPMAILHNWFLPGFADLDVDRLRREGLSAVLRDRGLHPVVAQQRIGARKATAAERLLLGTSAGEPLLTMTRRAYDGSGGPLAFGDHCYLAGQYAFDITVREG